MTFTGLSHAQDITQVGYPIPIFFFALEALLKRESEDSLFPLLFSLSSEHLATSQPAWRSIHTFFIEA